MLVKKMIQQWVMLSKGLTTPTHLFTSASMFEYEQKSPFLFNDMQMGSDILNLACRPQGQLYPIFWWSLININVCAAALYTKQAVVKIVPAGCRTRVLLDDNL